MKTVIGRAAATLLITGSALVGTAAIAQPAFALPGQTQTQERSLNDSSSTKVVTARCPEGTIATGGSALVSGTQVARINTAVPDSRGYTVVATEPRGGIGESWTLNVTANCIAPPLGLQYRTVPSGSDSATRHVATATCDPGKKVIGMGGSINTNGPGQDQVGLVALRSNAPNTAVVVDAHEDRFGFAGAWNSSVTAVCANPVPGLSYPSASSAIDSVNPKFAEAECPAGTKVLAGGFDVSKAAGQAFVPSLVLDPDLPTDRTRQGFAVTGTEDRNGFAGEWRVFAQAVCAS